MRCVTRTGRGTTTTGPAPRRAGADRRVTLGLLAAAATGGTRRASSRQHPQPLDCARARSPIPAAPSTSALSALTCAQSSATAHAPTT
jgi:hypothetical protein